MPEPKGQPPSPDAARDILAAEAFAMPAPEPRLGRGASLPVDPTGIPEPHDILAAEEFAMPAPDPVTLAHRVRQTTGPQHFRWAGLAGLGVLVAWLARRGR